MGDFAVGRQIADFVVFLLSDRSGVVTGSVISRAGRARAARCTA